MDIYEVLDALQTRAKHDPQVREQLLATRTDPHPVDAFCRVSQKLGYPIYMMDLISAGEDFYAAMRRSTNGGGENSPMLEGEDDFYELFMAAIQ
ncbi:MAG: hypothetical protein Q4B85_08195 [Lachnospiraceae bacterium]|nr:hypothetical protein [Lachnospiraceae bacterium]